MWRNGTELCEAHEWGDAREKYFSPQRDGSGGIGLKGTRGQQGWTAGSSGSASTGNTCLHCGAWRGELGLEPTPELYVDHLVQVFREVRRVLRDDGTFWLNLGDSYGSGQRKTFALDPKRNHGPDVLGEVRGKQGFDKQLVMIPARVALALQADGWYLRSEIVWHKPNPMPESVRDRPTKSHEMLYLLTKSPRYFYDADAIAEDSIYGEHHARYQGTYQRHKVEALQTSGAANGEQYQRGLQETAKNPMRRNKRDVWMITPKPFSGAHFAVMPEKLVEPCILAGTSERGCCAECGAPYERVTETIGLPRNDKRTHSTESQRMGKTPAPEPVAGGNTSPIVTTLGWRATCEHNAAVVPCVALDPFGGSGTVAAVALQHGRSAILIDLKPEYIELQKKRVAQQQPRLATV